jgi:hypothetical protein
LDVCACNGGHRDGTQPQNVTSTKLARSAGFLFPARLVEPVILNGLKMTGKLEPVRMRTKEHQAGGGWLRGLWSSQDMFARIELPKD